MCERLRVPARKVHPSTAFTLDQLALVETLAIGAHAVARAHLEFAQVIGWLEAGRLDPTPWITHRAGYDTLGAAFPSWLQPETGVVKAVLELG